MKTYILAIDPESQGPFEDDIFFKVFDESINILNNHQSIETTKTAETDRKLRGLLDVIAVVFKSSSKDNKVLQTCILKKVNETDLIDQILNKCLFRLNSKPTP